jgi:signal transduction histidine kinase
MFKGLYQRLAVTLLVVFITQGAVLLWVFNKSSEAAQLEAAQKLHLHLAEYVVQNMNVFTNGNFDEDRIKEAFHRIMLLGPVTELYILDPQGKILTYDAPDRKIKISHVDLRPIKQFLKQAELPILGDDPRSTSQQKIFSATSVFDQSKQLKGYLYIIIGGENYDSIVTDLLFTKVWKISLFSIVAGLIFLLLVTLILFYAMTRPLNRLCREVIVFAASDFKKLPPRDSKKVIKKQSKNELEMLENQVFLMEQRIVTQLDSIKQQDKLRREFFAYVSHDLRTPLAGMRAYLETLLDDQVILTVQERQKFIENILLNNKRLTDMVDELFELARLEHGEIEIQQENFVLSDLLSDLYASLSQLANETGIHLVMNCPNMGLMVYADVARLERVLQNLISNAIYYTPAGGTVTTLISQKSDQPVDISIQDTGNGIPAEELPYVFEPYYRAIDGKKVRQDGCGLGLAITQRLLALHNSKLQVESLPDQGARFYFSLDAY